MFKQIRWKFLLGVFKLKRIFHSWFGKRRLDYPQKDIFILTSTLREYETRARSVRKEPDTVRWIERHAKKGKVFYDVGANVGAYSLIAASLSADVYAFEPAHQNIARLSENVSLNGLQNQITILPLVLGDSNGVIRFVVPDATTGATAGFFSDHQSTRDDAVALPAVQLDLVMETFNIPTPSFIKIDVDGGELQLLSGARNLLTQKSLTSVLIEVSDTNAQEVEQVLRGAGFSLVEKARMDARTLNYIFDRI